MPDNASSDQLSRPRTIRLVLYNLALTLVFSLLLYQVIMQAAEADAQKQARKKSQATTTAVQAPAEKPAAAPVADSLQSAVADSGAHETVSQAVDAAPEETPETDPRMIAYVLWAISLAGGLGGVLSNLRGVFGFTRDQSYFPAYLELPFYLRPVSGVLCGLFTFFVSSFFSGALAQGSGAGWQTLEGMFPYIGIAFIAGFASQEFMERLKDTAQSLFGVQTSNTTADTTVPASVSPVETPPAAQDEGHESFRGATDLESFKKEAAAQPPAAPPVIVAPPMSRRKAD